MDVIGTLQKKQLLRVDEAAKILNVSRWTVYRWVEAGRHTLGCRQLENFQPYCGRLDRPSLCRSNPGREYRSVTQARSAQVARGERTISSP